MKFNTYFLKNKMKIYFFKYIFMQNCIYLFCLPLYSHYGLPLYLLSYLGNFLFLPLLITYLTACTLLTIFSWNNTLSQCIIIFQETLYTMWCFFMQTITTNFLNFKLIFLHCYCLQYLACWWFLLLLLILKKYISNNQKILFLISSLFLIITIILLNTIQNNQKLLVLKNQKNYYLIQKINKTTFHIATITSNGISVKKKINHFMQNKILTLIHKFFKADPITIL